MYLQGDNFNLRLKRKTILIDFNPTSGGVFTPTSDGEGGESTHLF